jgi:hypothetical protein
MQTEGFIGNGALRVVWETRNEAVPNTGTFEVNLHSGVSGRPLAQVVEQRGAGHGTAYVSEDPRDFYLLVESTNLDWSVTVEEAIAATAAEGATAASGATAAKGTTAAKGKTDAKGATPAKEKTR